MEKWKWVGHWACVLAGSAQAQHITWAESRTPRCPLLSLPALAHNRATELEPNLLPIHACAVLACLLRCAAQALALPREITAAGPSHTRPFPHPLLSLHLVASFPLPPLFLSTSISRHCLLLLLLPPPFLRHCTPLEGNTTLRLRNQVLQYPVQRSPTTAAVHLRESEQQPQRKPGTTRRGS